jgi:hypothetical protein
MVVMRILRSIATCFLPALICLAGVTSLTALPGCHSRPLDSQEAMDRNDYSRPDPAIRFPYTGVGAPGQAESPQQEPPPGTSMLIRPATQPTFRSIDPADPNLLVRAWVDGLPPTEAVSGNIVRIRPAISRQPKLRFEMDARLGPFRAASIQIYRVVKNQPDGASCISLAEDGDYTILLPGKEIDLARLKGVTCRRMATGETLKQVELDVGCDYEIQFLISGSRKAGPLAVRIHTAPPLAAVPGTQPDNTARPAHPDEPDPSHLPPGVTIPK